MTNEEREELRQEMMEDCRRDELEDNAMRRDYEYAWDKLAAHHEIEDAVEAIKDFIKDMEDYGWEVYVSDVFDVYYTRR